MSDKPEIRERVWALLTARRVARFPLPLDERIPNFTGAERAAERLAETPEWKAATRLKCNPDAPQRPVRLRALSEGKLVFMAVPRLRDERCFLRLDPAKLGRRVAEAATIAGATRLGEPVEPESLGAIDLVVTGSVAVSPEGARVGKGGGYSDLEFALARELGALGEDTPVATTVHELQILGEPLPMTDHDVPLDLIATPERLIWTRRALPKPKGILWEQLSATRLAAMPVLLRIRRRRR